MCQIMSSRLGESQGRVRDMQGFLCACKGDFCSGSVLCWTCVASGYIVDTIPNTCRVDNWDQTLLTQRLKQVDTFLVKDVS